MASYLGYILIFLLLVLALVNFRKYRIMVLAAYFSGFLARFLLVAPIRRIYPVARPFDAGQVNLLVYRSSSASFPSGHTSFFFALSFFLLFWFKKVKTPPKNWRLITVFFFLSAFSIGVARIYCGLHWPFDVLGGAVIGLFSGWFTKKAAVLLLRNF